MSSRVHGHSGQEKRYINQGTAQELYEKGTDSNVYHGHSKMPVLDPVQICGTPVSELPAAEFLEFSSSSIAFHESTRNIHDDKSVLSPMPPLHSVPNTLSNTADLTQPTSNILPVQQIVCNPSLMTNTLAIAVNAGSMPAVCPQTRVFDPRGTGHGQEVFSPEGDISDLMVPFACFNNSINDCGLTTTASSVEDLSGIVRALHGEWMQRLAAHIGDSTIGAKLSQQSPFETGIRVLQKYWNRGDLPKVFGDAFALIEIAFACAWMYHRDDRHGYWRYFFEDILKLPYVLLTNEDKILFRKTADLIWCPPRYMSAEALYPSGLIGPCWRQPSTSFELEGNVPIQAPCTRMLPTQGLYTPSSQSSVRPTDLTFRNNEVIRVCARYLDEIEFFGLCERNAVRLQQLSWDDKAPSENLQMITTHVIDPLMRWEGVNDFRDQIINSKDFLHRGLLRNPRELELKLAFDGRLSHPSATSYNEYRTRVASYCDDVMLQSNSSWRHYYYYKDLDTVLAIFHKQQIKINTGYSRVNPRPRLSIAPTLGIQQPLQHQSPLSARSDGSSYSTSSFFTVSTPSTFPGSSGSPSDEYNVITATDIYPSYSPVELPAPDSSLDLPPATAKDTLLRCDDCNTSFSGNIRNRIRNLRRHMETQHDKRSRHSCPELDSVVTISTLIVSELIVSELTGFLDASLQVSLPHKGSAAAGRKLRFRITTSL
ncbi:hypothetical protein MMC07_000669 [Pseudocyphellaria aurata]|nr:hypothetical protein [Pseudocyphellaria aurata]